MMSLKKRIKFMRPRDWIYSILTVVLIISVFVAIFLGAIVTYGNTGGLMLVVVIAGPLIVLGGVLGLVYFGYRVVRWIADNRSTRIRRPK